MEIKRPLSLLASTLMLVTSSFAGPNGKLQLFGGIQGWYADRKYVTSPDPLWKPVSQGQATGNQFPANWWRDDGSLQTWDWYADQRRWAAAAAWCQQNGVNGPTVQLYYPQFQPGWNTGNALANMTAWLKNIAPYIVPGTCEIVANEVIYTDENSDPLLSALGGPGATGYDGLINLVKLERQYLPGALLGLNEPGVCDNYAGIGFYATQKLIQVYQILKAHGAALDWFGNEGYWENFTTTVDQVKAAIDTVGSAIGVPIMFTEFTPGGWYGSGGQGGAQYNTQQECWQAYLSMFAADPYVYGVTGPWGGFRKSNAWNNSNWFYNDMGDGAQNMDCTNAPIAPSLTWLQQWVAQNVGSANPTP